MVARRTWLIVVLCAVSMVVVVGRRCGVFAASEPVATADTTEQAKAALLDLARQQVALAREVLELHSKQQAQQDKRLVNNRFEPEIFKQQQASYEKNLAERAERLRIEPDSPWKTGQLAELESARDQFKQMSKQVRERSEELPQPDVAANVWWQRLIEGLRAGGGDRAELLTALKGYAAHAKVNQKYTKDLFWIDKLTLADLHEARYQSLEADSWLATELAR